jgi:hypothetical protein
MKIGHLILEQLKFDERKSFLTGNQTNLKSILLQEDAFSTAWQAVSISPGISSQERLKLLLKLSGLKTSQDSLLELTALHAKFDMVGALERLERYPYSGNVQLYSTISVLGKCRAGRLLWTSVVLVRFPKLWTKIVVFYQLSRRKEMVILVYGSQREIQGSLFLNWYLIEDKQLRL